MSLEERLLLTIEQLLSQNREDPDDTQSLCIAAIKQFGTDKFADGYASRHRQAECVGIVDPDTLFDHIKRPVHPLHTLPCPLCNV